MKDFNRTSNPPRPVSYAEASGTLREKMDALLDVIQDTPFDTTMPYTWGKEPQERLAAIAKEELPSSAGRQKDLARCTAAALAEIDIYLGLEDKIMELYTTRYMPLTRASDIDVGLYTKEGFEHRFAVLKETRMEGLAQLATIEARLAPEETKSARSLTEERLAELKKKRPSVFLPKKPPSL